MLQRISCLEMREDFQIFARFDDGKEVLYDMREDIATIAPFKDLEEIPGLFAAGRLDKSRTCVEWNDFIDLPSHALYEYGVPVSTS